MAEVSDAINQEMPAEAPRAERKQPTRHPSTAIPAEQFKAISYLAYLSRLEPPLTSEQAKTYRYVNDKTGQVTDEANLRSNSRFQDSMTRTYLRVLWDLGLLTWNGADSDQISALTRENAALMKIVEAVRTTRDKWNATRGLEGAFGRSIIGQAIAEYDAALAGRGEGECK